MQITTQKENNCCIIALNGDLDASSAILLDNELKKALEGMEKKILVDCEQLNYISSAGLGVFMSYLQEIEEKKASLVIYNLSDKVKKVFEILGLDDLLKITKNKEQAIQL